MKSEYVLTWNKLQWVRNRKVKLTLKNVFRYRKALRGASALQRTILGLLLVPLYVSIDHVEASFLLLFLLSSIGCYV